MKNLEGKTMQDLVDQGILPSSIECIPGIGTANREEFEQIIKGSDAYKDMIQRLTKVQLAGSEKQIAWAEQIREKKAHEKAFEIIMQLYLTKINASDIDYNKYAKNIIKNFAATNAKWWIENKY